MKTKLDATGDSTNKKNNAILKRRGYDHIASKSAPDLLYMPVPDVHARALEVRPPQARIDPGSVGKSAGVESAKMHERNGIDDLKHSRRPIYEPTNRTDPITHLDPDGDSNRPSGGVQSPRRRGKDPTKEGPAGVGSLRMTRLKNGPQHKKKAECSQDGRTDPLTHFGGTAPAERKPTGTKQFVGAHTASKVSLAHTAIRPAPLSFEEMQENKRSKEVRIGAEVLYNFAGAENMLPASTKPYAKADRPPSLEHRRLNDLRNFALCQRGVFSPVMKGDSCLDTTEDMYYSMFNGKYLNDMYKYRRRKEHEPPLTQRAMGEQAESPWQSAHRPLSGARTERVERRAVSASWPLPERQEPVEGELQATPRGRRRSEAWPARRGHSGIGSDVDSMERVADIIVRESSPILDGPSSVSA